MYLAFNHTMIAIVRGKITLFTLGGKIPPLTSSNGKSSRCSGGLEHQQPHSPVVRSAAHFESSDPVVSVALRQTLASHWERLLVWSLYCGLRFSTPTNKNRTTVIHLVHPQEREHQGCISRIRESSWGSLSQEHFPCRSGHRSMLKLSQWVKE